MWRRKLILTLILLIALASIGVYVFSRHHGNVKLSAVFTSTDGSFTFRYPVGWYVETLSDGRVEIENMPYEERGESNDALRLEISPPTSLSDYNMLGQGTTPVDLVRYNLNVSDFAAVFFSATPAPDQIALTPGADISVIPTPNIPIVTFVVDGRPAAWGRYSFSSLGYELASMLVFIDVGGGRIVSIYASSYFSGGTALLDRYQDTILAIADTIRYSPLPTPASNDRNLPQTFTGTVGAWSMGDISFNYPADWYVVGFVTAIIQNAPDQMTQHALESGQMQAMVIDPATNMALIKDWEEVVNCRANPEGVTALAVMQKQLPSTPEQQAQAAQAGITYSQPEVLQLQGKDAVLVRIHQDKEDVLLIEVDLGNGNVVGLMAFAPEGEISQYEATLLAVAGTFSYTSEAGCNPPTARPVSTQTAEAGQITPSPLPTQFYATAVPGQKIAIVSASADEGWQIFLMDTNGQNRIQLTHMQQGLYSAVAWSPDGSHIAFTFFGGAAFASPKAYVMRADGSDVQLLSENVESARSWSPDSQRIALISRKSGTRQIYTVSIDGSGLRQITAGTRDVYGMDWSPDGQQIVFFRGDYNIYGINADGTGEYALTNAASDEMPVFSPDGAWIAFASGRADNRNLGELFVMNANGSGIRQLTNNIPIPTTSTATVDPSEDWYSIQSISWSPDGRHIAFLTKKMGDVDAFVIDPDGTNLHHIASRLFGGLSWSPDSQHVTFSAGPIGEVQTFIADADGSNVYALADSNPFDGSPMWSPNLYAP